MTKQAKPKEAKRKPGRPKNPEGTDTAPKTKLGKVAKARDTVARAHNILAKLAPKLADWPGERDKQIEVICASLKGIVMGLGKLNDEGWQPLRTRRSVAVAIGSKVRVKAKKADKYVGVAVEQLTNLVVTYVAGKFVAAQATDGTRFNLPTADIEILS
jgi:hypothetical protein